MRVNFERLFRNDLSARESVRMNIRYGFFTDMLQNQRVRLLVSSCTVADIVQDSNDILRNCNDPR